MLKVKVAHVQEDVHQSTLTFRRRVAGYKNDALYPSSQKFCPKLNLIKDKIPVLGLDIVEYQV